MRRRAALAKVYQRGVAEGALQKNLDFDLSTALLFGPMLYRYIFDTYVKGKRISKHAPKEFVEQVVDAFLRSFGAEPQRG